MNKRQENFERAIADYDQRALEKCVKFDEHRYLSVEKDPVTGAHYVKGHKSLRGACSHMARSIEEGDVYVPDSVVDLDTGERTEVDLFVHVVPRSVEAVSALMPREAADFALNALEHVELDAETEPQKRAAEAGLNRALKKGGPS